MGAWNHCWIHDLCVPASFDLDGPSLFTAQAALSSTKAGAAIVNFLGYKL